MFTAVEIKILAGVGLLIAVLVGIGLWNKHQQAIGAAESRATLAEERASQAHLDLAAEKQNRAEETRRTNAIQEKANVADQQASAARADAAAARSAGDRLRNRLAAADRARGAAGCAPVAGASAPGPDEAPRLVSFDVFEGLRGVAGQAIAYADDLNVRLNACVASYDALTP
jgi:hypothetical protein